MPEVMFGDRPNRVTTEGSAPDDQILDLGLHYSSMTLVLRLLAVETPGVDPGLEVSLETAMDADEKDWVPLGAFTELDAAGSKELRSFKDLLRYVRWNVTHYKSATAFTFTLRGIVR